MPPVIALPILFLIVDGSLPVKELKKLIVSLALASSSVRILTYLFKSAIYWVFGSSFLIGLFAMKEALEAYVRVDKFSSI